MINRNEINLMPYQWEEFNGDYYISQNFIKLKEQFNISHAVELGTCLGSTAIWLGKNFTKVDTIEINQDFGNIAKERIIEAALDNVSIHIGNTTDILPLISIEDNSIIFIDSHWYDVCPMIEELRIIADKGIKPVIAIHDFLVPNEDNLGYDFIHNQSFNIQWITPYINAIYGVEGYSYYYNSDLESTDIKRGIIYITPKQ
ncbi:MAG: hypothetical protein ACOVNU_09885 [Candidatus Kapaibacteriota bacterium]